MCKMSALEGTNDKQTLGAALRVLRNRAGLTQEQFAALAGADPTYLSQLENGRRDTRWTTVMRLLRALGATLADLGDAIDKLDSPPKR
jgi:transcriptional regulator with XRE-family HTH domain